MEKQQRIVYKESGITFNNITILEAYNILHDLRKKYDNNFILEPYQDYDSEITKYYVVEIRLETDEELNKRIQMQEAWERSEYERLKAIYG